MSSSMVEQERPREARWERRDWAVEGGVMMSTGLQEGQY